MVTAAVSGMRKSCFKHPKNISPADSGPFLETAEPESVDLSRLANPFTAEIPVDMPSINAMLCSMLENDLRFDTNEVLEDVECKR
ncbi:hypothetical protein ANCCAN_22570 [Ancylostoma caninum]|uniref:Uncharacterized protein n=1 Tax=Ancylostoma caninum TaxID=29170 RepID=A0A368FJB9_ANCCA|nr:hypothetical protein ANCCAN_22570 [Ancylostoma caninum]